MYFFSIRSSLLNDNVSFLDSTINDSHVALDVHVDCTQLPVCTNEEGEQVLRMYWLDAYEDYYKQPGNNSESILLIQLTLY